MSTSDFTHVIKRVFHVNAQHRDQEKVVLVFFSFFGSNDYNVESLPTCCKMSLITVGMGSNRHVMRLYLHLVEAIL